MTYEFIYEFMYMKNIVKSYLNSCVPRFQMTSVTVTIPPMPYPLAMPYPHFQYYSSHFLYHFLHFQHHIYPSFITISTEFSLVFGLSIFSATQNMQPAMFWVFV